MAKMFKALKVKELAILVTHIVAGENMFLNISKLQRLMFAVYGTFLVCRNTRIVNKQPRRLPSGAGFKELSKILGSCKYDAIDTLLCSKIPNIETRDFELIEACVKFFGQHNARELENWSLNVLGNRIELFKRIPDSLTLKYFKEIIFADWD